VLALGARWTLRPRTVVANNLIFEPGKRDSLARKIKRSLVRHAFATGRFHATVNSLDQIPRYSRYFGVPEDRFHLVHDSFDLDFPSAPYSAGDGSVFSGGAAYRDWETYVACARALPDRAFVGVARRSRFAIPESDLPPNLTMHFDIPGPEFLRLLGASSVVCLPLTTDAPAGLIVLLQAALHNRPVVTTRTGPTQAVLDHDRTGLMYERGDAASMSRGLETLLGDPVSRERMAQAMEIRLRDFSPEACGRQFLNAFDAIESGR